MELISQNFTFLPFIGEANTATKTTMHHHDLYKKRSSTTIVKMPPRRQNEISLHEVEIEEIRRQMQLLQETVNAQQIFSKPQQRRFDDDNSGSDSSSSRSSRSH
jgi:hypothetical protein